MALQPCTSYRFTFSNPPECTILKVKLLRLLSWERGQTPSHNPPPRSTTPPSPVHALFQLFFHFLILIPGCILVPYSECWRTPIRVLHPSFMSPSFFAGKFACVGVHNVALRHNFMNLMILRERRFLPKYKNYCKHTVLLHYKFQFLKIISHLFELLVTCGTNHQ